MDTLLTGIGTILGVALLVIARDWRDGKHIFKKNGNSASLDAYNLMQYLKEHYNDSLSDQLREMHGKLERQGEEQQKQTILLQQWDKFGIPVRDCEKLRA